MQASFLLLFLWSSYTHHIVHTYVMIHSFSRFRNGIKDLEVMMQNLIVTAFETVTTVEQGIEVLDVFMHLSSREVILV